VIHQVDIKFIKLTVCTAKKKEKKKKKFILFFYILIQSEKIDYMFDYLSYIYIYPTIIVARPCDPNVGEAVAVLPAVNR
jgi:hypothetical protein